MNTSTASNHPALLSTPRAARGTFVVAAAPAVSTIPAADAAALDATLDGIIAACEAVPAARFGYHTDGTPRRRSVRGSGVKLNAMEAQIRGLFANRSAADVAWALSALYGRQVAVEQGTESTILDNTVGFNVPDAEALSALGARVAQGGALTAAEVSTAAPRLAKYARQLAAGVLGLPVW